MARIQYYLGIYWLINFPKIYWLSAVLGLSGLAGLEIISKFQFRFHPQVTHHWVAVTTTSPLTSIARAIARMSDNPQRRPRGRRGGNPHRSSQVARHKAGLVSHLDFHDPDRYPSDRVADRHREERSRSSRGAGEVPHPIEPPPPKAAVGLHSSSVVSVPKAPGAPTLVSESSVAVPISPPPARDGGHWVAAVSWVWVPEPGSGAASSGPAAPAVPTDSAASGVASAEVVAPRRTVRLRSRSPLPRRTATPTSVLADPVGPPPKASVASPSETPKVAKPKKAKSPKGEKASGGAKGEKASGSKPASGSVKPVVKPVLKPALKPALKPVLKPVSAEKKASTKASLSSPKPVADSVASSSSAKPAGIPVEVTSDRSSSPAPVGRKRGVPKDSTSKAVATPPVKAPPVKTPPAALERPLIALDWHKTISFERFNRQGRKESYTPATVVNCLKELQQKGYQLCIVSFSTNLETQRATFRGARLLEESLERPFQSINIVCRKYTGDRHHKASLTGSWASKAELVKEVGAAYFIDDQRDIVNDVLAAQVNRARGHTVVGVVADSWEPSNSLKALERALENLNPQDVPKPSLLQALG